MNTKSAALFAGVASILHVAGLIFNYGSVFVSNRNFQPTVQFLVVMFTSILTYVALAVFFFTLYGKEK